MLCRDSQINQLSETLENMSDDEVCRIARKTIEYLENDEWAPKQFVPSVFGTLVERLHDIKQYDLNRGLAEYLPLADILKSGHAFECAYAYAEKEQPRATDIYEAIVKREPNNSSAINNLGVRYEHAGDLYKALDCYERAVTLAPNEKIHQNNLTRIKNLIYEKTEEEVCAISDAISVESLENIGYTDEFCRKLFLIHDNEMRDILQRDLRECAIAVVAGQDKAATIMCGSIIEALLMLKIKERGISKYDVSAVSKGKTNHPVSEMSLLVLYVFFLLSYCNSFLDINQVKFSFLYFGLIGKFLRMNSSCSSFSVLLCLASPTLFSGSRIGLCIIR